MSKKEFHPEWVAQARSGDQDAIANLYNCAYQDVYIVLRSMIRADEDTVLDLLQDTFVKAFQRLEQLNKPQKYHAWVKQIARNTALDHLKKSKAILFSELHDDDSILIEIEDEDPSHLPDVVMDKQESYRLLLEMVDSLPDAQRVVISMYYLQGIPAKEIADILGKDEGTVRSQLKTGRDNLNKKLRELEEKEHITLYGLSPIPFLIMLLRNAANAEAASNGVILGNILQSGAAAGAAAGSAVAGTVAGSTTTGAAGSAVGATAAKAAGSIAAKKIAAGILAATVLTGGTVAYTMANKQPELPEKDLFANDFHVTFSGEDGSGVANVHSLDGYSLDYAVEPGYALSNGDIVILTLTAPNGGDLEDYCAEHYGFTPTSDSMEYIVSDLDEPG